MRKYLLIGLASMISLSGCQSEKKENSIKLKNGKWYAEFKATETSIPFTFEVVNNDSTTIVTLINGDERVELDGITYKGDSVFIPVKAYDTQLSGLISGDSLSGVFKRLFSSDDAGTPFKAYLNNQPRFLSKGVSNDSIAGKWDIQFITENETKNNVGIFSLNGDILTGSVLTSTGDLRYLEGVADAEGFRLSAFAGLSPYLIEGKFTDKDHFEGRFVTSRNVQQIKGIRNDKAALADPYSMTKLKSGYKTIDFKFPNANGEEISLADEKFKGKVVIVSVLGSWCPNCLDEAAFLSPWYKENKDRGVEIVGLAFERKDDPEYVKKVLSNLIQKYGITYDVLFAAKLGETENALPALDGGIKSYPTTIFIDKKGNVRKIHTGFNGPATGLFYDEFKADFNKLVDDLLKE